MKNHLIVILGPTASGKTALAVRLAAEFGGEIISADSRQVYRGMDLGTGKDLAQYNTEKGRIPGHLIDILDPAEEFNVFEFQKRFYQILDNVWKRKRLPVLVGGTGLYLESVLSDYIMPYAQQDEELRRELSDHSLEDLQKILSGMKVSLHNRTDLNDRDRLIRKIEIERTRQKEINEPMTNTPAVDATVFGIHWDRAVLRKRIADRLKQRVDEGLIEEVLALRDLGISWQRLESFGLEYRHVAWYLQEKVTRREMIDKLQIAIGQFAKRQMTWFRRMERKGIAITWIPGDDYDLLHQRVIHVLK